MLVLYETQQLIQIFKETISKMELCILIVGENEKFAIENKNMVSN